MSILQQAVCPLSIVPVRRQPDDRSEQVTQWLFGEAAELLERQDKWSLLRFPHDGYQGWVDNKQLTLIPEAPQGKQVRSLEQFVHIATAQGVMVVPFGAVLPGYDHGRFTLGAEQLSFPGRTTAQANGTPVMRILALKEQWMHTPYLWGGRSPFGVDCSGLTQMLFLAAGLRLPRDAYQQAQLGKEVAGLDKAASGDLAFFHNDQGRVTHVGIVLEHHRILHASGKVRIDTLDEVGILDQRKGIHTHRLHSIRRLF